MHQSLNIVVCFSAMGAFAAMAACGGKTSVLSGEQSCVQHDDCPPGYLCQEKHCAKDTLPPQTQIDSAPPAETNARIAEFVFSCSKPDCYFRCRLDNEPFQACSSPKVYEDLLSGGHVFEVFAIDRGGLEEETPAQHAWTIAANDERTPPNTFIDSGPQGVWASSGATFTFSCNEPDCTFQCRLDSGSYQSCVSPRSYSNLEDGEHTFRVRAVDKYLNVDLSPASRTWTVDTADRHVDIPVTELVATPTSVSGGHSSATSAEFEFSCDLLACSFQCSLNGGPFQSCLSPHGFADLVDGLYTFAVFSVAEDGTPDPSPVEWQWVVDTLPPVSSIVSGPSAVGWHLSNTATFDFTATDPSGSLGGIAGFECSLNGAAFEPCVPPMTVVELDEGANSFAVRSIDLAGNIEPSPKSRTWRVDTVPPVTTLTGHPDAESTLTSATFMFTCNEPGCTFECSLNGGPFVPCSSPQSYAGLWEGEHTFLVQAIDRAGNVEVSPVDYTWDILLDLQWAGIGAGTAHACAINADASLWCWGRDTVGQTGQTSPGFVTVPKPVPGDNDWLSVDGGDAFTCGLRFELGEVEEEDGASVWCFGGNQHGQLGQGHIAPSTAPLPVGEAKTWVQLSSGDEHVCGIQIDEEERTLWCWGRNNHGQLGQGAGDDVPGAIHEPVRVGDAADWLWVSAGRTFTCGLRAHEDGGSLWCWGQGTSGRLGTGNSTTRHEPTQVAHTDWLAVDAGGAHACGVRALDDGSLWCWGSRSDGQVGDGASSGTRDVPTRADVPLNGFFAVAAGANHSCAMRQAGSGERHLYCFGGNATAAAGLGHTGSQTTPALVDDALDWHALALGTEYSCGLADGNVFCWGSANVAQLGLGFVGRHGAMTLSADDEDWKALSVGQRYACGIRQDASLWCWGQNVRSRLGVGDAQNRQHPALVASAGTNAWQQVSAGVGNDGDHTCAIQDNGTLWCWGWNNRGQLGLGSTGANQQTPQPTTGDDWVWISAGQTHTCGIRENDEGVRTLWCFGDNRQGQLGLGDLDDRHEPTQVLLLGEEAVNDDWGLVDAGAEHTCALKLDGQLYCFGNPSNGRLGAPDTPPEPDPDPPYGSLPLLVSYHDWTAISLGTNFGCGIRDIDGEGRTLWCFGTNTNRQLGHNATGHQSSPVREATNGIDWALLQAGHHSACGIRDDGSLWCWGQDHDDQLGLGGGNIPLPTLVDIPGDAWHATGVATDHGCGLRESTSGRRLWCSGDNRWGQLGNDKAYRLVPTPVLE